jgi:hypothetical protein
MQRFVIALVAGLLTGLVAVGSAAAQEERPDRWQTEFGLSVNSSGGNEQLTVITTELGFTHLETRRYELEFRGRLRYGRSDGVEVARNLRASMDADFGPGASWSPFLSATADRDPFRRLDLRLNSGSGVKRTFWREGRDEVSLSAALLYSHENRIVADTLPNTITHSARWSVRGRARRQLGEGTRVEQLVFYQPEWDRGSDYLLESQTTARVALSRSLALTSRFLYQRDSTPPADVSPDDWSFSVGLSLAVNW